MSKIHLCVCGFLTVSCLSGTLDSDVSLPHDFDFTSQLPTDDSVVSGTVKDCYSPDLSKTLHKVDGSSSSSVRNWKITNLNDVAQITGGSPDQITGFSFYIVDDDSLKLNIPPNDITIAPDGSIHLVPKVDVNQLTKFLTGSSIQVCLLLSGNLSKNFPKVIHNNFTFHVEVDLSKSL